MQLIKLTNQEETLLSYRKVRIISNHLAQLNTVLARPTNYRLRTVKAR